MKVDLIIRFSPSTLETWFRGFQQHKRQSHELQKSLKLFSAILPKGRYCPPRNLVSGIPQQTRQFDVHPNTQKPCNFVAILPTQRDFHSVFSTNTEDKLLSIPRNLVSGISTTQCNIRQRNTDLPNTRDLRGFPPKVASC